MVEEEVDLQKHQDRKYRIVTRTTAFAMLVALLVLLSEVFGKGMSEPAVDAATWIIGTFLVPLVGFMGLDSWERIYRRQSR